MGTTYDDPRDSFDARVEHLVQWLDIGHLLDRSPVALSGGELQRVMLARALALAPRILLLDEPLRGLDPTTQERLRYELARLHRELGTTTVHITHDHVEARALADRIAVIHRGRLEQVGSADEVFEQPATPFVARFTGAENLFALADRPAPAVEPEAPIPDQPILDRTLLPAGAEFRRASHIAIRPEHVEIHPATMALDSLPPGIRLRGEIEAIVQHGGWLRFTIAVHDSSRWTAYVDPREAVRHAWLPGHQVIVAVPVEKIHAPGYSV